MDFHALHCYSNPGLVYQDVLLVLKVFPTASVRWEDETLLVHNGYTCTIPFSYPRDKPSFSNGLTSPLLREWPYANDTSNEGVPPLENRLLKVFLSLEIGPPQLPKRPHTFRNVKSLSQQPPILQEHEQVQRQTPSDTTPPSLPEPPARTRLKLELQNKLQNTLADSIAQSIRPALVDQSMLIEACHEPPVYSPPIDVISERKEQAVLVKNTIQSALNEEFIVGGDVKLHVLNDEINLCNLVYDKKLISLDQYLFQLRRLYKARYSLL
ncbi:hypothetical protein CAS74_004098 [Pichia kudriavzevii]|uniref:Uncharacterized protein n=1 Tax=Pichia kudriavzevii TaxID=4909 RepID=A0A1Z8JKJ5_PICKU|nr:hypothetical protein CAS74_004098 [Pichia kudriavzevii]